jgi:hypothetical protein
MRAVCLVLCVLLLLGALVGCTNNSIVGTWKHDSANFTYQFTSDGKVTITPSGQPPETGTYTFDKKTNTLVVTIQTAESVKTQTVIAEINGNTMRLTLPDSGSVVTLTRTK